MPGHLPDEYRAYRQSICDHTFPDRWEWKHNQRYRNCKKCGKYDFWQDPNDTYRGYGGHYGY